MATRDTQPANDIANAALGYLARGWSVVPVRAREKRPLIAWQVYQQRRATEDDVRAWYARWPDANVAIVTGVVSGLVVVDVDPRHGGDSSLAHLERDHGPMPRTVEAISGGGGRHVYLAHPGGHVHNKVALAPGVDLRGDGGLVVAPPSVHPSGARYVWRPGQAPQELPLAPLPGWLLGAVTPEGGRLGLLSSIGDGFSPRVCRRAAATTPLPRWLDTCCGTAWIRMW